MSYMKDSKIDLTAGKLLLKVQQTKIRHAEEMKEFEAHLNVISTTKISNYEPKIHYGRDFMEISSSLIRRL